MQGYNLDRYKQNLHIDGNKVISYITHVATIDKARGKLYRHGSWSVTASKHINYVASYYGLEIEDKERGSERVKRLEGQNAQGRIRGQRLDHA